MASAYWYTFEVGLCRDDDNSRKILGGAVLTSLEESSHALSNEAKVREFDLQKVISKEYCESMQFSGIQKTYVESPPIKVLCSILDGWTAEMIGQRSYSVNFDETKRCIEVTQK